jgi:methionyl aminopeptidase
MPRKLPNLSFTDNHFKGSQRSKNVQIEAYIKAGKIASEVRERVRVKDWVGKTVYEVCEEVENEIKKRGAKCAFPVNASINEIAAHYTAEPNDPITIKDTDLVKIDLGAQIDGYIADTAVTVCYDVQFDGLVQAAEEALGNAMSMIKTGVKASDIGRTIETTIKKMGFKPIANLSGHSLDQYTIHAGKSIPNIWSIGGFSLSENSAYACEPFVTTEQGGGFVRNGQIKNIFALNSRKKTKNDEADKLLDFIWENFNMLPFALRWIVKEWDEKKGKELLDILIKKKAVQAYPVLIEINGQRVAQAEHTFIPKEDGVIVTTKVQ